MRRRLIAAAIVLLGLLGGGLLLAGPASAHATLVSSTPTDGSRLQTAPTTVAITFDEQVGLNDVGYLRVVDQTGRNVDRDTAVHPGGDGTKISVDLKPGLGDGTYTASFRIISADSHPVAGAIRFVVGNGALGAAISTPSSVNGATGFAYDVVRWVSFAGLALLGGGWLMLTVWPGGRDDRTARRLLWSAWTVTTVGALAELFIQGPYSAGTGLGDLGRISLLDGTLHTTFGTAHSVRLVLLGLLGGAISLLLLDLRRTRVAEMAGGLFAGVIVTYAASGHASAQNPRWLALTSDSFHLAAMATWIGGLAFLLAAVLPRRDPDELRTVLPLFSRAAFGSVVVLAITGTYQAWLGVGSIDALTSTRYGQLVLVKAGLFICLLLLGNLSRRFIQRRLVGSVGGPPELPLDEPAPGGSPLAPPSDAPIPPGRGGGGTLLAERVEVEDQPVTLVRMRRSVLAELALAAVVFGVTAVLVAQPPGRSAEATKAARPQQTVIQLGGGRTATVVIDPGKHGVVGINLSLSDGAKPIQLTATASLPAKQLGPINIPLSAQAGLNYSASGVLLPSAGDWDIDLVVRTSQFDSTTADGHVRLH